MIICTYVYTTPVPVYIEKNNFIMRFFSVSNLHITNYVLMVDVDNRRYIHTGIYPVSHTCLPSVRWNKKRNLI